MERRIEIENILRSVMQAVSASRLAKQLGVSRQVIVGDIALLRAGGLEVLSTPRGYLINQHLNKGEVVFKIACLHGKELTESEIYTIVDNGGRMVDVMIEHPIYGQLIGQLDIGSRFEADDFLGKVEEQKASLLTELTDGIHLHTIACRDEESARRIKSDLQKLGILLPVE